MKVYDKTFVVKLTVLSIFYDYVNCGIVTSLVNGLLPGLLPAQLFPVSNSDRIKQVVSMSPTAKDGTLNFATFSAALAPHHGLEGLNVDRVLSILDPLGPLLDPLILPVRNLIQPLTKVVDGGLGSADSILTTLDSVTGPILNILEPILDSAGDIVKKVAKPVAILISPIRYIYEYTVLQILNSLIESTGGRPITILELESKVNLEPSLQVTKKSEAEIEAESANEPTE